MIDKQGKLDVCMVTEGECKGLWFRTEKDRETFETITAMLPKAKLSGFMEQFRPAADPDGITCHVAQDELAWEQLQALTQTTN